jgi:hypothetical protein
MQIKKSVIGGMRNEVERTKSRIEEYNREGADGVVVLVRK